MVITFHLNGQVAITVLATGFATDFFAADKEQYLANSAAANGEKESGEAAGVLLFQLNSSCLCTIFFL